VRGQSFRSRVNGRVLRKTKQITLQIAAVQSDRWKFIATGGIKIACLLFASNMTRIIESVWCLKSCFCAQPTQIRNEMPDFRLLPWSTRGTYKSLARPSRKQANVSVRMAWFSFGALPCRKRNLKTARVSILLKSIASLTCFRACFLPGRAKDLPAPRWLRTALLWVTTQRVVVICYLHFGTTYRSHPQGSGTDRLSRNVGNKLPLLAA